MADQFDKLATAIGHLVIAFNELEVALGGAALLPCEFRVNKAKLTRRSKGCRAAICLSRLFSIIIMVGAQRLEP